MYNYDRGGNILSKVKYAYTTGEMGEPLETISYSYGDANWKDKLTNYNGSPITYDAIGNPLNDGTWTYTWQAGRQLAQMSKSGMTVQFRYNHSGLRTQKIVTENGVTTTTEYIYHGKLLTHMVQGNDQLHFFYDAQSRPAMVDFNGVKYTYLHNLQGDIVGLLDSTGVLVVEYKYDAWGKPVGVAGSMAATLGEVNPLRYRGYVWDEETGLYYLRSRYYKPEMNRFINADILLGKMGELLSHHEFAYCHNQPCYLCDKDGFDPRMVELVENFENAFLIIKVMRKYNKDQKNSDSLSFICIFDPESAKKLAAFECYAYSCFTGKEASCVILSCGLGKVDAYLVSSIICGDVHEVQTEFSCPTYIEYAECRLQPKVYAQMHSHAHDIEFSLSGKPYGPSPEDKSYANNPACCSFLVHSYFDSEGKLHFMEIEQYYAI